MEQLPKLFSQSHQSPTHGIKPLSTQLVTGFLKDSRKTVATEGRLEAPPTNSNHQPLAKGGQTKGVFCSYSCDILI
ncbi:hypothetical protein scyTo_0003848 [Scyliorhinus torazame]|uniref:Uncharacterized protein n=1 Tax=Scyliorhinus torazame TaxID=75743 RepID=A0A401PNQ4_SCYTO|nr:hypothetical protein [Scyliorhinus torazame]